MTKIEDGLSGGLDRWEWKTVVEIWRLYRVQLRERRG
jgi:hypothetical protein